MRVYIVMDCGEVVGVYKGFESFREYMLSDQDPKFPVTEEEVLEAWKSVEEYEVK